jgi:hypothetical protein
MHSTTRELYMQANLYSILYACERLVRFTAWEKALPIRSLHPMLVKISKWRIEGAHQSEDLSVLLVTRVL